MSVNWEDPSSFPLAVFLSIVGAAGGLCMAYAVAYLMGATRSDDTNQFEIPMEQARYMREVRARNISDMTGSSERRLVLGDEGRGVGISGKLMRSR